MNVYVSIIGEGNRDAVIRWKMRPLTVARYLLTITNTGFWPCYILLGTSEHDTGRIEASSTWAAVGSFATHKDNCDICVTIVFMCFYDSVAFTCECMLVNCNPLETVVAHHHRKSVHFTIRGMLSHVFLNHLIYNQTSEHNCTYQSLSPSPSEFCKSSAVFHSFPCNQ